MYRIVLLSLCLIELSAHSASMDCEYEIALPREKFSSSMSSLVNMTRDSLLMMLTAFNDSKSNKVVSEDSVTFDCSAIFPEAKEIFKTLAAEEKYIQVFSGMKNFLKGGAYHRAQQLLHPKFTLPPTLEQLEEKLNFKAWPHTIIAWSQVKGKKRVLYRNPNNTPAISIAQTVDENGSVRETEIILKREDSSGNYDFYAYGANGMPAFRSPFLSSNQKETVGAVPYTCMTCHYDGRRRIFQPMPTSFHP